MNISSRNVFVSPFMLWAVGAVAGLIYLFTFQDGRIQLRPDRINFGIDLVGGTYIRLDVQTDKAIEAELVDMLQHITHAFEEDGILVPDSKIANEQIVLSFDPSENIQQAVDLIKEIDPSLTISQKGSEVRLGLKDIIKARIKDAAVTGNIEVLRTRLDALGVGEITIAAQGDKSIIIELPNVDDPQKAKAMIGKTALLEFKLVEEMGGSEEELLEKYGGELPGNLEILPGKESRRGFGREYYIVEKYAEVSGRDLKEAYASIGGGQMGSQMGVHFKLKPEGAKRFYDLTKKNYGRPLAIIIDNVVISAPRINEPIAGEGFISGNFNSESAAELATMLKSGAFVAPVTFEEERQVGPSLGQESIRKGLVACLVGLALLVVFGVSLYKVAGIFALFALIYNLLLLLCVLSWLRATLSLPGIAGMVLTVGMAIDASVLIYEKIKEELLGGSTPRKAVEVGFSDAMTVILDSNITTFLVGIVLYKFGVGPIQGFAVTMMVGIVTTLLTGLFFLRSALNFALYNLGMQKLKI